MLFTWFVVAFVAVASANECEMGQWGAWTEWTKLDCGEQPSGAAAPTRGKYQPHTTKAPSEPEGYVECVSGFAGIWPCGNVDQVARMTLEYLCGVNATDSDVTCGHVEDLEGRDVVAWTDSDGLRYAIFTMNYGVVFVRLPVNYAGEGKPVVLAWMEGTDSVNARERDALVVGNYLYVTANASNHGMQIFDLTELERIDDSEGYPATAINILPPTGIYRGFDKARSLIRGPNNDVTFVAGSDGGTLTCNGGLFAMDTSNPQNPDFLGCYGPSGDVNDGECVFYTGPDERYTNSTICFLFNGVSFIIVDATNPGNMQTLSTSTYEYLEYASQGTVDFQHINVLSGDEMDEIDNPVNKRTRTLIWNCRDLTNPNPAIPYTHEFDAIDHHQYLAGDRVYQANHEAGFRILRLDSVQNQLFELGYFDAFLDDLSDGVVQFNGATGIDTAYVDAVTSDGTVLAITMENGAWVLKPDAITMAKMVADGTQMSERYRYRDIISADDITVCPNTVDVDSRFVKIQC